MEKKKIIEILWTGGFDSTFRICQLSRMDVTIQPYYLSDNRKSEQFELKAIKTITKKLVDNIDTKATFNDLIVLSIKERKENNAISLSYNNLLKMDYMGSQYEWLAIFALDHKGIELSIHKDDKAIALIEKHGKLISNNDGFGNYYILDKNKSEQDCINVFGNFHFPLAKITKLQMKEEYEKMGLSDIMNDTWFCFTPINGKPCGCCNPCVYTIEEGMSYRFSKKALRRYKFRKTHLFQFLRKIKNLIKK